MVGSFVPVSLDLLKKAVLVLLGTLLDLCALGSEVRLELFRVPAAVWCGNLVFPVGLDKVDEVFTISGSGEWDVVVRQPSLKLSLVPLVVCYRRGVSLDCIFKV